MHGTDLLPYSYYKTRKGNYKLNLNRELVPTITLVLTVIPGAQLAMRQRRQLPPHFSV